MRILRSTTLVLGGAALACTTSSPDIPPREDYAEVVERLTAFIEHEMADKRLPALSIALVDDQEAVWARGFGYADPEDSVPATAATVYRIGSVSKLFTDLGIMQGVERGEIDLDVPVTEYLPDLQPSSRYGAAPTLRQLMSHRSGLVREPPSGHYFDDGDVTLAETVRSLNGTEIVYEPETRIKYSNAGIATVGYVLERVHGQPFADYLRGAVLDPLGMERSAFTPEPAIAEHLAVAYMWTYDGRTFEAPTFQLGMAPAGSMYAPVTDLAKFMSALFAGGQGENGRVVSEETLEAMYTPQFAAEGATTGYGIGFGLSELSGHRRIGHGGAIYGFATDLAALPDERLGAAAVTTMDGANTVVRRITTYALRLMLAARAGDPLPEPEVTDPVPSDLAARVAGEYGSGEDFVRVVVRADRVYGVFADSELRLRARGDTLIVDDRHGYGARLLPVDGGLMRNGRILPRREHSVPPRVPARWRDLIGEYGWDYNTLYVYEDRGQLQALIEWFYIDPLTELSDDQFAFPNRGLYHGEELVFRRDAGGNVTDVVAAGIVFPRRDVGTESGETFTIEPVRPVEQLRTAALAASPPDEDGEFRDADLVELRSLDSSIAYDIRYATTNNFMQSVFYQEPHAFMQRPAADAVVRAHRRLGESGYGLLIHDAYRPWFVTKFLFDATPE